MTTRRSFVRVAAGAALSPLVSPILNAATTARIERRRLGDERDTSEIARDEAYWDVIQRAYIQDASFINIESGFFSPAAEVVLDAQVERLRLINRIPSFYMRRRMATERADLKRFIGRFVGVSPDESPPSRLRLVQSPTCRVRHLGVDARFVPWSRRSGWEKQAGSRRRRPRPAQKNVVSSLDISPLIAQITLRLAPQSSEYP